MRDGTVARILEEYGEPAKLVRWTKGAYDVPDGSFGAGSTTEFDVTLVTDRFEKAEIDGTRVKREDKKFIMGGADEAPIMNDKLKIGSELWEVIRVVPIQPGGVIVAFEIQARK